MNPTQLTPCFGGVFAGKRVLVTGHTGFKGAWLAEWLLQLGAGVTGYALPPPTNPSLFAQLGLESRMEHLIGDVRDAAAVEDVVRRVQPDYVFHLAAQPLVRTSYAEPVETFGTNVLGTAHVLEALRRAARPAVAIIVTTDKCYENREWLHSYREEDPLGGHDPYSASKAAAELVVSSYRRSFFSGDSGIRVASVRAGNVVGGGDWATDRIVPDCVRALIAGQPIAVRNRVATRPWQHVLEPLSGYLWLAALLSTGTQGMGAARSTLCSAFNFGPELGSNRSVAELVEAIVQHWPGHWVDRSDPNAPHEAGRLSLSIDKVFHVLGWRPVWNFAQTVAATIDWYRKAVEPGVDIRALSARHIGLYVADAQSAELPWSVSSPKAELIAASSRRRPAA